ncbi:MAG: alcohol dehydrogenase catalytic domain-containing protein [Desulfobacterales bacterium]|jgi:2-desacetyl-2-hydroxyethyl bacteriochlorophyllide A dehydrogenase
MKAAYYTGNKTFAIESVQPIAPDEGEVQVRVAYCGICGTDLHVFHGAMDARVGSHRVIGHEMSGKIAAIGEKVQDLKIGDPVVIRPLAACGSCPACQRGHTHICQNLKFLGLDTDGAFQQSWTVPAHTIHKIPADLSIEHAALIEPVAVACHDVRRARLIAGEDTLVIGGGPIGMLIAMVAGHAGARVTVSEVNAHRLDLARSLGFATLDPKKVNVAEEIYAQTADKGADVIFEVSGTQAGVDTMTEAAATRCRIVMVAIHATKPTVDLFKFFWREIELFGARVYEAEDYEEAIKLVASGAIDCNSIITDVRPLEKITDAFQALSGNAQAMKSLIKCS